MQREDIEAWARRIDAAFDTDDEDVLRSAQAALDVPATTEMPPFDDAARLLNLANIHAHFRQNRIRADTAAAWMWNSSDLIQEVRCLRFAARAAERIPVEEIKTDLPCRIFTNLGNLFSHIGRTCEAIYWWDRALAILPNYGMALGNKGYGVSDYSRLVFDRHHSEVLLKHALDDLARALTRKGRYRLESHAVAPLRQRHDFIARMADWSQYVPPADDEAGYGATSEEREYRRWCLRHRLFVNPLNDVVPISAAACDSLPFPALQVRTEDSSPYPPAAFSYYSQLKREYASARYTLFEATRMAQQDEPHFADRGLHLSNGLDYRITRLWVDRMRYAFAGAYAVLDKIGPFMNHHWGLGLDPTRAELRSIWFVKGKRALGLNPVFDASPNLALRGLYWLSKDIYLEAKDEIPMDPDAADLYELRHEIIHRYLSIHLDGLPLDAPAAVGQHRRSEDELYRQALKMLSLVRSALIYLPLAAHRHEGMRPDRDTDLPSIPVPTIGDEVI